MKDIVRLAMAESSLLLKEARAKIDELTEQLAYYKKKERVEKLAARIEEKGLSPSWGRTREEMVQHLLSVPQEKIAVYEEAVDLAVPDGSIGSIDEGDETGQEPDVFEQYLMGMLE